MTANFRHPYLREITLGGQYRPFPEEPLPLTEILAQTEKGDPEQFLRVFFCYRIPTSEDRRCVEVMLEAIKMSRLELFVELISVPPREGEPLEGEGKGRTESAEHKGMKRWLRDFFISKDIKVVEEVSFLGYEVDVGSLKEKLFIECGDTEPRKVFEFLRNGLKIGILQYNSEEIVWFKPSRSFAKFEDEKYLRFL
ncbi:MAG: hypothetical protein ABSF48_15495 [Thermodesulfobacteriota bacterium]|jgi:hypothetical protein